HRVAASFAADAPGRKDEIERRETVLDALRVMLDAARVEEEARPRGSPDLGGTDDELRGNAGDLRGVLRRVLPHRLFDGVPPMCALGDEGAIDPAALDHHVKHAVQDADV